jgi:long-subunit acyl-CoA synthetase (AMP-forming)
VKLIYESLHSPGNNDSVLIEQLAANGCTSRRWTYEEVGACVAGIQRSLEARGIYPGTPVGVVAANGPQWVAADLAVLLGRRPEVPVPLAFSGDQAASLLREVPACLVDEAGMRKLAQWRLAGKVLAIPIELDSAAAAYHAASGRAPARAEAAPWPADEVIKVVHTSGTTGAPKGVKIAARGLESLLLSLQSVVPPSVFARYLTIVPFSLLIEQVTGIYLPILNGGRMVLLPEETALLGTAGSRGDDVVSWLRAARPTATVLPPAAVSALDKAIREAGGDAATICGDGPRPFLMAGGAPVDVDAQLRLDAAGLRIHEGYGLSENSSVVSWNTPAHWRPGTVGRPLPHCQVKLSPDGELLVTSGSLFAGYTAQDPTSRPVDPQGWLHTGDRAEIDEDGYIRILGRLKNVIITSHGRNVSPEWVEGSLRTCPSVTDAVVFGNGMEHLVAVLVTTRDADPDLTIKAAQSHAQAWLAETDRPETFVVMPDSTDFRATYFTVTGRPRRQLIYDRLVAPRRQPHKASNQRSARIREMQR